MLEYLAAALAKRKAKCQRTARGGGSQASDRGSARKTGGPAIWLDSLQSLLATVVIAVFIITFIVQAFQIPSESMENTLLIGDYLLVDKLRYGGQGGSFDHFMPYRAGAAGRHHSFSATPCDPRQHFVKRVIGVPGDRLRLVNRQVYVNGIALPEPYARHVRDVRIPSGTIFRSWIRPVPGWKPTGGWR